MTNAKPKTQFAPNFAGIPSQFRADDRWAVWRYELDDKGKWKKTPYSVATGCKASFKEPNDWASFAAMQDAFTRGGWDGVAYASPGGIVQIDIDLLPSEKKRESVASAHKIVSLFPDHSGFEFSASGNVHGFVLGTWHGNGHRSKKVPGIRELEIYDGERWLFMTGESWSGLAELRLVESQGALAALADEYFPLKDSSDDIAHDDGPATDEEIIVDAGFDPLFRRLMDGELLPGECGDQRSDAEWALACKLVRYTSDREHIRRIMMQSALKREKWDRPDYLTTTIDKAIKENAGKPKWSRYRQTTGGLAQRFLDRYAGTFRYVSQQNRWLRWNGKFWENDEALHHERAMKSVLKRVYEEARIKGDKKVKRFAESRDNYGSIMSALAMARSDEVVATAVKDLDRDPHLMNCNNGTLNLRNWEFKPHDPADLITKMVNADYAPAARSERWQAFIDDSFRGCDPSVPQFLQTLGGYSLLGMAPEKVFMLLYGPQNSGKGTFIDALLSVLGSYADTIPFEALLKKRGASENQPQLAKLPGVRVVGSNEGPKDRRWDTELLKTLAGGGDEISVAGKYQHPVTFRVAFKIWLATNNLPQLDYDDHPAWGRVVIIRFPNERKGRQIDPQLRASLVGDAAERTAILSWFIEGYRRYLDEGLVRPLSVRKEVERYRRENDPVGDFVKQCCKVGRNVHAPTGMIFVRYRAWYEENYPTSRLESLSHRTFIKSLERYDVVPSKSNGARILKGICLLGQENGQQKQEQHKYGG